MFRLDGRVALVTGAASGIGAATARVFAEAGADVALGWYAGDPHDVEPVLRAVEERGRRCLAVEVDVDRTVAVEEMVATAGEALGPVDIVVANAAIAREVPSDRARRRALCPAPGRRPRGRVPRVPGRDPGHGGERGGGGCWRRARSRARSRAGRATRTTRPPRRGSSVSSGASPSSWARTASPRTRSHRA